MNLYSTSNSGFDFYFLTYIIHFMNYDKKTYNPFVVSVIKKFAENNNIQIKTYSDNWLIELQKNKVHRIVGFNFDLSSASSLAITRDKFLTSEILNDNGILAVNYKLLFAPDSVAANYPKNEFELILENIFDNLDKDVVIKPNFGTGGADVFRVADKYNFISRTKELFKKHSALCFSRFLNIDFEYRITVLDGMILNIYKKQKTDNILFNLSKGAKATTLNEDNEFVQKIKSIAKKTMRILDMRLANVDIIKTSDGELFVLEVNGGIAFEHYSRQNSSYKENATKVYNKILQTILEEKLT